jgi:uncharacterized cupin superfamily protein
LTEARLEQRGSGLAPVSEGWFVLNVGDAAWFTRDGSGSGCVFESRDVPFSELGINIRVLPPGQPNARYHRESAQEDFLVLAGECLLLIEGEERRLEPWDFVHCPQETEHVFVGAGDEPCVVLMVGARRDDLVYTYPVSELAKRYGAGVERETTDPAEAYAGKPPFEPRRPEAWPSLPWS